VRTRRGQEEAAAFPPADRCSSGAFAKHSTGPGPAISVLLRRARPENEFLADLVTVGDPDHRWEHSFARVKENLLTMVLLMPEEFGPAPKGRECPRLQPLDPSYGAVPGPSKPRS
jgi:hypothetical protein